MSATTIRSATGALMSTIGKKRDGTYTVRSYLCGDEGDVPIETWFQDGFATKEEARQWAIEDMQESEQENGWTE